MRIIKLLSAILFSFALASCGGGGGGSASSVLPTTVTGTVATGQPLGNAQITLTDSKGVSRTATSSASGKYTIDVTGLTAPFVIKATGLQGTISVTLVSVKDTVVISSTNVINITPLTTVISAMLSSTGRAKDLDAVNDKAKIISSLTTADNYTETLIAPTLTAAGLSTTADPITTPFVSDGTGYDSIYDHLQVGETSKGTIFMGPRCTPQIVQINGHCTEYSDPGDQTTTYPNLCGSDIATGAGIPCDPNQPITANPSVALPIIGPSDVAGGFAISGPGVHFGPADTPPPPNPLNLTTVTVCIPGTSGCLISSGSGLFSGGGTVTQSYSSGTLSGTCTFSLAVSGNYSVQVTTQSNGSYAGSATVTGNFASTPLSSTGSINCIATSTGWSTSSQVSGTIPNITWTTTFVTPGGHTMNGTFAGTISESSITGVSSAWN